jgi:hypothetical protein
VRGHAVVVSVVIDSRGRDFNGNRGDIDLPIAPASFISRAIFLEVS